MNKYLIFCLFLLSGLAHGFNFGDGSIDIPDGFNGPFSQSLGPGVNATAFIFEHTPQAATLLQISSWNPGKPMPEMSREQLEALSSKYLLEFLSGIERKREEFKKGVVTFVKVSNHPVAKIEWEGVLNGKSLHGTMYCFILNSKIYSFHTQDQVEFKGRYKDIAVKAFESANFIHNE